MKSIKKYTILSAVALSLLGSCSNEFLEVDPKGQFLESNYYQNYDQAFAGLVAAYDPVGWISDNYVAKEMSANIASDDHYTGGGNSSDVLAMQVWTNYTLDPANGPQDRLWQRGFQGAFRTNTLLSKLPNAEMNETDRSRFAAEAKFLRAYYYFDLIRLFERIPLITEPIEASEVYNIPQVDRGVVFAQIEKDLMEAMDDLPIKIDVASEGGRATQGAAKALLGKVYLQQEKFTEAAAQLSEVNGTPGGTSKYGYKLLDNFGDLFDGKHKFNEESIFEVSHSSSSNAVWDCIGCSEGNLLNVMSAPRSYAVKEEGRGAPEYISGWGFNTVSTSLAEAYINADGSYDGRYKYTVSNIDSLAQLGVISYDPSYQNTGYFLEKFAGKKANQSTGGGNWELNFPQNFYDIRLADTYLMEAEALVRGGGNTARAQALLDAVRTRSGNAPIPVTFENIFKERRLELAGEGHRWYDLVRTGKAAEALKDRGYVEGKHDKLPIPLLELNNTVLEQDPAY
ncbi:RagB/SusD family nutrient uptake outer membrane protein [Galbibacter sp. BG1]